MANINLDDPEAMAKVQEFANLAERCSPGRILGNHAQDQGPHLFAHTLSASHTSGS
jgi:hypothetical protein